MSKGKGGIRIGSYRVTPLGIAVFCVVLLAIAVIAVILVKNNITSDPAVTTLPKASESEPASESTPVTVISTYTPTPAPLEDTAEPTSEPTPTPEPAPASATIRFLGEISADDNVISAALQADGTYSFADMLSMISGVIGDADYTVADVEGSMGGVGSGYKGKSEFNTPEVLISDLADMGVDMLALANDHALDAFYEGLQATLTNCENAGMDYVGAASSQEAHDTPKIVDINGINVCFLNYTTTLNSKEKATSEDAVKFGVNLASKSNCKTDVTKARSAGADIVIAIMSWSKDGEKSANANQQKIAKELVKAGVDVIIGYGTRTVQPVGWLEIKDKDGAVTKRTLCVCSLGTFLSSSTDKTMDFGTIFELTIKEQADGTFTIENPTSIPTYVWRYASGDKYTYRVLACGEWAEEQPEGMADDTYARLKEIWEKISTVITKASTISAN